MPLLENSMENVNKFVAQFVEFMTRFGKEFTTTIPEAELIPSEQGAVPLTVQVAV